MTLPVCVVRLAFQRPSTESAAVAALAVDAPLSAASGRAATRAERPPALTARQHAAWQPLIDWAAMRYDAGLTVTAGILPHPQSPAIFFAKVAAAAAPVDEVRLLIPSRVRSAPQGDVLFFPVEVREIHGRGEAVQLSCADLPASMTCTFHPPSITPRLLGGTSFLTVNVPPTLTPGTYVFGVYGQGVKSMDTQTVELTVTAP